MPQVSEITVLDGNGTSRDVATLTAIAALIGEVAASPTANTLLARLKEITDKIIAAPATAANQASQLSADGAMIRIGDGDYETVAAGQTNQALGAAGAAGDYLLGLLIIPATTAPGAVQIKDGAGSAITVFTGGADSVSNLVPFLIPLGIRSAAGAWQVTTGNNVSALAAGSFT